MNHQRIVVAGETLIVKEISFEKPLKMLPRDPPPGCGAFFVKKTDSGMV